MSNAGDKSADAPYADPPVYEGYQAQDNVQGMNQPLLQPLHSVGEPSAPAPGNHYGTPAVPGYAPHQGYPQPYGSGYGGGYPAPTYAPEHPGQGAQARYQYQQMPPGQPQQGPGAPGAAPAAFYPQQGYVPGLQQQQQQQQQLHAQGQYHQQQQYAQQHYAQQQPQLQQHQQPHQQYPGQNNGRPVVLSGANGRQIVIVGSVPVSYQTPVWRTILMSDLCGCFDDCTSCCIATWFPACLSGHNQSQIGGNCLLWCMCYPCAAGYGRQRIEAALGAPESSCCLALCLHWHCGICALTQEARALNAWIAAGRPSVVPPAVVVSV